MSSLHDAASSSYDSVTAPTSAAPGKAALTQRFARASTPAPARQPPAPIDAGVAAIQRAQLAHDLAGAVGFFGGPAPTVEASIARLQRKADAHTGLSDDVIAGHAARGVGGAGQALPHLDAIQRAFGPHDVSGVRAHVGGAAAEASTAIGAHAYATGNDVAFARAPDLFLAAHEAAHVVQQRQGVHLSSAVGQDGDVYERHADEVAAAVVRGDSAAALLGAPGEVVPDGIQRTVVQRADDGPSLTPVKKLSGAKAAAHVAHMLPKFQAYGSCTVASSNGPVQLVPGAIWLGDRMLLHGNDSEVFFTMGSDLYEQGTPQFVRDQWYGALGQAGKNAMGMVYLAKIEAALLEGIFVPWWGMLGLSFAETALFYELHQVEARAALDAIVPLLTAINDVRTAYPTLFKTLAIQILKDVPSGISGTDVAFFLGRCIGGAAGAAEGAAEKLGTVSLTMLAWIAAKCATLVTLTHAPSILAGAASTAAKKQIADLQAVFLGGGQPIDAETAAQILVELAADPGAAKATLTTLAAAAEAAGPALAKLRSLTP